MVEERMSAVRALIMAVALLGLLGACGEPAPTAGLPSPTSSPAPPTDATAGQAGGGVTIAATGTPPVTMTPLMVSPTLAAAGAVQVAGTAPAAARPTATDEADECERSVGQVLSWYDEVANYKPDELQKYTALLNSACVEDRWLAIWLLGSVHDVNAAPALQGYITAHPQGDWLRDEFDLLPVARAAISYVNTPLDPTQTYAVADLALYNQPKRADGATGTPNTLPAGSPLRLLGAVQTGQTVPDHGGTTDLIFEQINTGGSQDYYIDISPYVASYPRYFEQQGALSTP